MYLIDWFITRVTLFFLLLLYASGRCVPSPHNFKNWVSALRHATFNHAIVIGDSIIVGTLFQDAYKIKQRVIHEFDLWDPCPPLLMKDYVTNHRASMDVMVPMRVCHMRMILFLEEIATGRFRGHLVAGNGNPVPAFKDLAWLLRRLRIIYIDCLFSRQIMVSRTDKRYVAARKAFNEIGESYVLKNCDMTTRPEHAIARETFEGTCSNMEAAENLLRQCEELNANIELPQGYMVGIKLGRLNISRIEHEFGRFRNASGHAVMSSVDLERLGIRRMAGLIDDGMAGDTEAGRRDYGDALGRGD